MRRINTKNRDMRSGPLFGQMVVFALPIIAMNLLQLFFNAADMIVVGRFAGKTALAAVGATGSLINLIVNLFMGLAVGTSVVVANDTGAGRPDAVSRTVHTSIAISIMAGLFVMIFGLALCKPLLGLMGTPVDIIDLSTVYMRIYFLGVPASMLYNFSAAILRAVGDSRRPMYYLVIGGIVNVILNLFFVIVLNMSVAGVAWATTISQYLSLVLILICLVRSEGGIRLFPAQVRLDRQKLKQIIAIGLPAGGQSLLFSISNVLIQSAVNSFGSTMIAASAASANLEGFVNMPMSSFYSVAITYTGQNMGAKKYDRIDSIAKVSTVLIFATWAIIGGITLALSSQLLGIYSADAEVIALGSLRLKIMVSTYFTAGLMNVFPGLTRSMGFSIQPMIITLLGACILRIIWLYTFFAWFPTQIVLFLCYPISWLVSGIGQVWFFFHARLKIRRNDPDYKPSKKALSAS